MKAHGVVGLDHVQLLMPPGADAEAAPRRFYGTLLGLVEVPKPAALAARPGLWFLAGGAGIHLAAADGFEQDRRR